MKAVMNIDFHIAERRLWLMLDAVIIASPIANSPGLTFGDRIII